ncbi:cytochrome c oxidase subunit 7B, mitochondrial-like [Canis lupus familiaris]|nr:cytochrome c oxidase subunit 7B, mitochondrial-like [Canis lupus dingo]XP_038288816.1 cytochrome c oxidase subunit 7B, mitochondrial-like [Canis lupus familiaris]XP_038313721.1 cytochrome c oxidase subunit 7B, mitochondrial-like [Canis lupus familiaris]XP_038428898.1 cytochrome c oxidase subunit 7B, mitochondrial-like [Canis lupus familiaris]
MQTFSGPVAEGLSRKEYEFSISPEPAKSLSKVAVALPPAGPRFPYFSLPMFPWPKQNKTKNALSHLQVQRIQQTIARRRHQKRTPDFHDTYGKAVLAKETIFCVAYTATQTGIEGDLSPVGRVTPKEWRDQ